MRSDLRIHRISNCKLQIADCKSAEVQICTER
jgi:hypothetical protein